VRNAPRASTLNVSRELGRISGPYDALEAGGRAGGRQAHSRPKRIIDNNLPLCRALTKHLSNRRSPRQALLLMGRSPRWKGKLPSHETVYDWIYRSEDTSLKKYLTRPHRYRGRRESPKKPHEMGLMDMIITRPEEVHNRLISGHWEGDSGLRTKQQKLHRYPR